MVLNLKLAHILKEQGMTQRELSELSGVPSATLSDLVRDKRTSINKEHLSAIATALDITDIRELIELRIDKGGERP